MEKLAFDLNRTGMADVEVGDEILLYFAQTGQMAATSVKQAIEEARQDARKQQETKEKNEKIQRDLDGLLAKLPEQSKPGNIAEIQKLLQEIAGNQKLTEDQRRSAKDLIAQLNLTKPGDLAHNTLPTDKWEKLQSIAKKYEQGTGPLSANNRTSILAWITLYTGEKHGKKFIGSETSKPAASPEDLKFLNDVRKYLNERQQKPREIDWQQVNTELRSLFTQHAESQKETYIGEDEAVRTVQLQLGLQYFNNSINGASASAKAVHDAKKSVTDRI
ncbi:MAG: hypothetical protein RIR70_855 [Pseudomonadota bacterium]|jgi:hypothetical protein